MSLTQDRPTLIERYDRAAHSSDLTCVADRRTDADILLAAGFAAAGNKRGQVALTIYRMAANQDTAGHGDVIRESTGWLMGMQPPKGVKPPRRHEARSISMSVVAWWLSGVCRHCQGRRYDLVPGTQVVSENLCRTCFGAGREPVEHRVAREHAHAARWLANQYEDLMSYILADMARRLRSDMRFFASKQEGR